MNRRQLLSGTAIILASAMISPAMAQEAVDLAGIEEIQITGSYIRQKDTYTAPVPTTSMDRAQIESSGAVDLTDLVRNLPINTGSETQSVVANQLRSAGTAQFNIRGLGLGATLTLVNGKRNVLSPRAADDGSQFVDINLLPLNMIERIEIVKDGSSALYGSDAVAGVVNLITRNNFEGFEIGGSYQTTTKNSQQDMNINGGYGYASDRTNFVVFASHLERTDLASFEREDITANTFTRPLSKSGTWIVPALGGPTRDPACGSVPKTEAVPPFLCLSDISTDTTIVPDENRTAVFSRLEHQVNDNLTLSLEGNYGRTRTTWKAMHSFVATKNGFVVPANHPNNPFTDLGGNPTPAISFLWAPVSQLEYEPLGVSFEDFRKPDQYGSEVIRTAAAATYDFGNNWYVDVSGVYSESKGFFKTQNEIVDQIQLYLNGGPDGNTYFNPFGSAVTDPAQANSLDVINAITGIARMDSKSKLYVVDAVASGPIFDLPAGPVGLAIGTSYRKDTISAEFDAIQLQDGFAFFGQAENFSGSLDSIAVFSELAIPLASDLNAQVASRYEEYGGGAGSTFDPKLAVSWDVTDGFLVRGTVGTSFRAPSPLQTISTLVTPSVAQPICQPNGQLAPARNAVAVRTVGNPDLKPEESTSYTAGLAYQSNRAFQVSFDYWRYDYKNVITRSETNSILAAACAAGGYQTDPRIQAAGNVATSVDVPFQNAGGLLTEGLDFSASYAFEVGSTGELTFSNQTNYIITYRLDALEQGTVAGAGWRNNSNFGRAAPKWRSNFSLAWAQGNHGANAIVRYVSSMKDDALGRDPAVVGDIGDFATLDLQYSYLFDSVGKGTVLTIGAINVTNETPPAALSTGWEVTTHDPRGRLVYARLKTNF